MVAISGQSATMRMHKESHQYLDLVNLFRPITKYRTPDRRSRKPFPRWCARPSSRRRPAASGVSYHRLSRKRRQDGCRRLDAFAGAAAGAARAGAVADSACGRDDLQARYPIILAGNGVIRAGASEQLLRFAEKLNIPVATTFMAKGVIPFSHPPVAWRGGTEGLRLRDVRLRPRRRDNQRRVRHGRIPSAPVEPRQEPARSSISTRSRPRSMNTTTWPCEVQGHVGAALRTASLSWLAATRQSRGRACGWRSSTSIAEFAEDRGFPIKPQKICWDMRQALPPDAIVISDVGAHKMWMARMYQAERPNTCIISNGFASMGIGLPGAIAAKLAYPERDRHDGHRRRAAS